MTCCGGRSLTRGRVCGPRVLLWYKCHCDSILNHSIIQQQHIICRSTSSSKIKLYIEVLRRNSYCTRKMLIHCRESDDDYLLDTSEERSDKEDDEGEGHETIAIDLDPAQFSTSSSSSSSSSCLRLLLSRMITSHREAGCLVQMPQHTLHRHIPFILMNYLPFDYTRDALHQHSMLHCIHSARTAQQQHHLHHNLPTILKIKNTNFASHDVTGTVSPRKIRSATKIDQKEFAHEENRTPS